MHVSTDTTRALDEMMGIPGVPPLKDDFDAPEHLSRAPRIDNLASGHFHLDAKVALYSGNRINNYAFAHYIILL
jgi:hypothetical protein